MTILTLVRHGETDWNARRLIQGSTDIPLNDTGRAQARETGLRLRDELVGTGPLVVASSDLSRARETAEIIADALGAPAPRAYRALRERGYGEGEGVEISEFATRWGADWRQADVPGAESWADLRSRALTGLRHAVRDARRQAAPQAPALVIVSHGALIRELIQHASAGAFPAETERLLNGSSHTFLLERDRLSLRGYSAVAAV